MHPVTPTRFRFAGPHGPLGGIQAGRGPAVVLLAGLGSTHRIWGDLPALLARRHTVLCPDNRGVGQSRGGDPFTLEASAEELEAVLNEHGVESAALLGASMGGLIALTAAAALPHRVSRLVLASCAARLSHHGRRAIAMLAEMIRHLPPASVGECLMTLGFAPPFHQSHPGFVREAAALYGLAPEDAPGALAQAEHLLASGAEAPDLSAVTMPALVLAGERDPVVAVEDTAKLAAALPRAELVRVRSAAHSVLAEGGGPLLERVLAFLSA